MEDFTLRAWELPPHCKAPLVAPADATTEIEWRGLKTEAIIRTVRIERGVFWVFFQLRDEPLSNYVMRNQTSWPIKPWSWNNRPTTPELLRIVRIENEGRQLTSARFFYLREPQNAVAFFPFPDSEFVSEDGGWVDEYESLIDFKMRAATKAWDSPRLYDWLLKTWKKSNSEVHFSWQWSRWNHKYRHQWLYPEARGINELVQVMNWALQSEPTIGNDEEWRWYFDYDSRYDDSGDADRFWPEEMASHTPWTNVDMRQTSPRLWRLRQFFISYFLPLPPLRITKPPSCVRDFDDLNRSEIMARRKAQTAHEQLEAALHLREWLQDKAAPEEIERLLPF